MDRSQYLIDALKAIGAQPQSSPGGTAANLGAVALNRFAQQRQQRALAQALAPQTGMTGLAAGGLDDGSLMAMSPSMAGQGGGMGGLAGLGQKFMGLFR